MIIVEFLECAMHFFISASVPALPLSEDVVSPSFHLHLPFFHHLHLITVSVWYHIILDVNRLGECTMPQWPGLHEAVLLSASTAFHISPNTAPSALC